MGYIIVYWYLSADFFFLKMSVVHFAVKRTPNFCEPIKSKVLTVLSV